MADNHTELCECDCLNYCGDDPDLSKRKARPCRSAIDWAHEQALAIDAERERQRKVDMFESQAARIQQQALEYLSLLDQCSQHLARITELEADRDSWRDQCSQRVADWNEIRKERDALIHDNDQLLKAASAEATFSSEALAERDALKADAER